MPTDDEIAACADAVRCPDCESDVQTWVDDRDHIRVRVTHATTDCPMYQAIKVTRRHTPTD